MSFKAQLEAFAIAQGLKMALGHVERSQMIQDTVKQLDRLSDEKLGSRSEPFQQQIVQQVLLPMCVELMKENPEKLNAILEAEQHKLFGGIGSENDRAEPKSGQNFQPKRRS